MIVSSARLHFFRKYRLSCNVVWQRELLTVAESFLKRDSKMIPVRAKDIVESSNTLLKNLFIAPPITGNLNVIGERHPAAS